MLPPTESQTPWLRVDERELNVLIERNYVRIMRAAMVLCGRAADAEDLTQETFLQAMRARAGFSGHSLPDTWLYSILLNVHRKHQRSLTRRWKRLVVWYQQQSRTEQTKPRRSLESEEWRDTLWAVVAQLPSVQRDAIVLRYSEGLTYEQIADVTKSPVGTVRSRLHHGLKTLRQRLEEAPRTFTFLEAERS